MKLINLFGSPGAGKSTGAAYISAKLKMRGIEAELITEHAKDKVWENSLDVLKNQLYIVGQQSLRTTRLDGKVEVAVTDSPLMLSILYREHFLYPEFDNLIYKVFSSYDNINYFIERDKPYNPKGRLQSEKESDELSLRTIQMLDKYNIPYIKIKGNESQYNIVVEDICKMFESDKER